MHKSFSLYSLYLLQSQCSFLGVEANFHTVSVSSLLAGQICSEAIFHWELDCTPSGEPPGMRIAPGTNN